MATSIIRTIPQLEAMAADWEALASRFEQPLLRHDWFLSCAEACHAERDLSIVAVHQQGRLTAVAPLALARRGVDVRLEFLGMSVLREPAGVLFETPEALDELARAMLALGRPIVLQRLDAGGPVPAALRRAIGWRGLVATRPTWPALGVRVGGDWESYQRTLSSRLTSNLVRLRKRAGRLGPVTSEVTSPTEAEVDGLLALIVEVEGSGWKGRQGSALRDRTALRSFVERYAHRAARSRRLRVAVLRIGERVAAVELGVEDFRRWWQLKIGYADDLAQYYPGLQLTHETVHYAFEQGLDGYEFLGSAADWETRWNPEEHHFELCLAYPATLAGGIGLAADGTAIVRRRVQALLKRSRVDNSAK